MPFFGIKIITLLVTLGLEQTFEIHLPGGPINFSFAPTHIMSPLTGKYNLPDYNETSNMA